MTAPLRVDPRRGLVRGVRAAVLTVPAVGVAGFAHVSVDGCASPLALLGAAGLLWPAAVALLGARRRMPALTAWLVLAQVVTHVLLERMCDEVVSGQATLAHHLQDSLSAPMAAAHLVAALFTATLLGRADAGLWIAQALLRAFARVRLPSLVALPTPAFEAPGFVAPPCLRDLWKAALPVRRGPPALAR